MHILSNQRVAILGPASSLSPRPAVNRFHSCCAAAIPAGARAILHCISPARMEEVVAAQPGLGGFRFVRLMAFLTWDEIKQRFPNEGHAELMIEGAPTVEFELRGAWIIVYKICIGLRPGIPMASAL